MIAVGPVLLLTNTFVFEDLSPLDVIIVIMTEEQISDGRLSDIPYLRQHCLDRDTLTQVCPSLYCPTVAWFLFMGSTTITPSEVTTNMDM